MVNVVKVCLFKSCLMISLLFPVDRYRLLYIYTCITSDLPDSLLALQLPPNTHHNYAELSRCTETLLKIRE